MKKTLVLASLLAAFGAASAQSSVTLTGATSFGYQKAPSAVKGITETDFSIIVKGTESLGNGMSASFSTELDNGTSVDQFRSAVTRKNTSITLAGAFGAVTLANTRSGQLAVNAFVAPTNLPDGFYDGRVFKRAPVDALGYNAASGPLTYGISYSESAVLPTSTTGGTTPEGKSVSLTAGYKAGALALNAAYRKTNWLASVAPAPVRHNSMELGATYDAGVAKLGFGLETKPRLSSAAGLVAAYNGQDKMAIAMGVSVPMGANAVGVNYAKRGSETIKEIGFQANLSARTNVNFSAGKQTGDANSQYRLSVNHAF